MDLKKIAAKAATQNYSTFILNSMESVITPSGVLYDQAAADALYVKYKPVFDAHPEIEVVTVNETLDLACLKLAGDANKGTFEYGGVKYRPLDTQGLTFFGTRIYRNGYLYEVYYDPHGESGELELGVEAKVPEGTAKQFLAAWGTSYVKPGTMNVSREFFTEQIGYKEDDRERIDELAVGQTCTLDAGDHTVTRLA